MKDEMKTKLGFVSGADVSCYACVDQPKKVNV